MNQNEQFIEYHHALMELCHHPGFFAQDRRDQLAALTRLCADQLAVDRVSVWWLDPVRPAVVCEVLHRRNEGPGFEPIRLERDLNPAYFDALMTARVVDAPDAREDARTRGFLAGYLEPTGIQSMLDAPIFGTGELSGVICLESLARRSWTLPEISLATAIADTISLINTLEAWSHSQQQLDYVTHYDDLTGLPNLRSMRERLRHLAGEPTGFALMWIDLDRLKSINDGMGQVAGNQIINAVANRLRHLLLPGKDKIARAGGDDFILLIRGQLDRGHLRHLAGRILSSVAEPLDVFDQSLALSASVGISTCPEDGRDPATLLKNAEAAMYHAKQGGRGRVEFFNQAISADARSRFLLESELRRAIADQALTVHYQPIIRASDRQPVQLEALVRWEHPDRGLLAPIHFLDLARSAGLMAELGEVVMRRACADLCHLHQAGHDRPRLAINLAAEQLQSARLPHHLAQLMDEHGLSGDCFDFEVTEDILQGDSESLQKLLKGLVDLGAGLSIDDFGTGYSSLARLKHMPFSKLKIDRSFIMDLPDNADDRAITLSIFGLARGLGLAVVAEGVEDEAQERWLTDLGCDYLQGYRYGRPMPMQTLIETVMGQVG